MARLTTLALVALLVVSSLAHAAERVVPAERQALLLVKCLSYDDKLDRHGGETFRIGVVYQPADEVSEQIARDVLEAWRAQPMSVRGRAVQVVALPWSGVEVFRSNVSRGAVQAVYVASGLDDELSHILAISDELALNSLTGVDRYVSQGVGLGLRLDGDRPRVVINVDSASRAGSVYSAQLLKIAEVREGR